MIFLAQKKWPTEPAESHNVGIGQINSGTPKIVQTAQQERTVETVTQLIEVQKVCIEPSSLPKISHIALNEVAVHFDSSDLEQAIEIEVVPVDLEQADESMKKVGIELKSSSMPNTYEEHTNESDETKPRTRNRSHESAHDTHCVSDLVELQWSDRCSRRRKPRLERSQCTRPPENHRQVLTLI